MSKRPRGEGDESAQQMAKPTLATSPHGNVVRSENHLGKIASEVGASRCQVKAAARLLDEGNTLPFIARYRKEATESLDEGQLRSIAAKLAALDVLEAQRSSVLVKLEKLGALSEGLKKQVVDAESVHQVEDLYLPHRPKRTTKASSARDKGLAPLAEAIMRSGRSHPASHTTSPEVAARAFVRQPDVQSVAEALAGAQDILAEMAAELPEARERARGELRQQGVLVSQLSRSAKQAQQGEKEPRAGGKGGTAKTGKQKENKPQATGKAGTTVGADADTYSLYHDFRCPVRSMRPHQVLALNRGEAQGVLSLTFQWQLAPVEVLCQSLLLVQAGAGQPVPAHAELLRGAVQSGMKRLLKPAIEREIRSQLTEVAGAHAAQAFSRNLKHLLLQPPLPGVVVLGVDPAFRTGCKLAACDGTGKVLDTRVVYPHPPAGEAQRAQAGPLLVAMIKKHGVKAVAIGNGTASRETQRFVADTLVSARLSKQAGWCVVSEAGASVYSACELASKELPGLDVSLRGAVSIARRLQDPLSELVKVPPESLGVGQYQADLKTATLSAELAGVVESAVNAVGVDLNAASPTLLAHVAGLNKATAAAIVAQRDAKGPFQARQQLLEVKGVGPRTFQQCSGFLRVLGGSNLLDSTPVHPESYATAEALVLEACGGPVSAPSEPPKKKRKKADGAAAAFAKHPAAAGQLTTARLQKARRALKALLGGASASLGSGGPAATAQQAKQAQQQGPSGRAGTGGGRWISGESLAELAARLGVGEPTLVDILDSLLAPGRDVRGQAGLASLQFKQAVDIGDLTPGLELSGVVRNVVDFGAFVDVNAGQDGLIHVSELGRAAQRTQHTQRQQGAGQRGGAEPPDAYSLATVGDLVRVRVLGVDAQRRRISLAPI